MTDAVDVQGAVLTAGSIRLPPDPRSVEALGRNHTLPAALAELVDNSFDAGARHVLIRFVREGDRLVRLLVVDNGVGMDDEHINVAMTIGGSRDYAAGEIGRFGLGLKAASFSQAREVTVVSKTAAGNAVGRRWGMEHAKQDFSCELVTEEFAAAQLDQQWGFDSPADSWTVVRWDAVKGFPAVEDARTIDRFLQKSFVEIRTHLGLIFHRLLEVEGAPTVTIDVEDSAIGVLGSQDVSPLDPFGYPKSGVAGWPCQLKVDSEAAGLTFDCHIWPGRSSLDEFNLDGNLLERQGIYVYYNDRLVQRGGWNGIEHADKQLNLARVSVDVDGDVEQILSLRPEKNGIEIGPGFAPAVRAAQFKDGSTFAEYTNLARGTLKDANRRRRERSAVLPPGDGFHPQLRKAITRELPIRDYDDPVSIRWKTLPEHQFFDIDRPDSTLWLNKRYRRAIAGGRNGAKNDAPLIKALMFFLLENIFAGQNMGPRDKDNIEMWQAVLTAAARAEST